MLGLVLVIVFSALVGFALQFFTGMGIFWSAVIASFVLIILQIVTGLYLKKKIAMISGEIQAVLLEGQKKLNRRMQFFQEKPGTGAKAIQKTLEKDQHEIIRRALEVTSKLEPYCLWNPLIKKQLNAMRVQFHYQLREFDVVDKLIGGAFLLDPMIICMKIARMYKNNDPSLDGFFRKKIKRFRNEKGAIIYALYSWVLVQRGEIDKAIALLSNAKDLVENETLKQNWEHLANGRVKKFSNAGLGEEWYALLLEEPKAGKQKMQRAY